jgi:ketosteroid isomerase-like protein
MTEAMLRAYSQAWNDHDVDLIMSLMTDDCVFHGSVGPEPFGRTSVGQAAVKSAIRAYLLASPDCYWTDTTAWVGGGRGYTEWTLHTTGPDGQDIAVRGCDLYEFVGDKVHVKNAFRKQPG